MLQGHHVEVKQLDDRPEFVVVDQNVGVVRLYVQPTKSYVLSPQDSDKVHEAEENDRSEEALIQSLRVNEDNKSGK